MRVELPVAEALALASSRGLLPPMIESISCEGSTLGAEIDLRAAGAWSFAIALLAAAAGTVTVTARFGGYANGVVTFAIAAYTRGLPAHKLIALLVDRVNEAIAGSELPTGLLTVERGNGEPLLRIDAQKALGLAVSGMAVTAFDLRDSVIHLETGPFERFTAAGLAE